MHAVQPGESLADTVIMENKVVLTEEEMERKAEFNNERLSWGIVAFLRHKFKQRAKENKAEAYCNL